MDRDSICKSKEEGGLGIRRLRQRNQALLGKWLWSIGGGTDGLWRQVLEKKYGLPRNGWDLLDLPNKSSTIWRGILSVKKLLMDNIKYQSGTGERILFWKDQWVGDRTLAVQFPDLFNCAMNKDAKVKPLNPTCLELVIRWLGAPF